VVTVRDMSALDLIDAAIAELEAKLNLAPGESLPDKQKLIRPTNIQDEQKTGDKPLKVLQIATKVVETSSDQPEICKLEFKVGLITKVWVHPDADKLYCEEIDVGETEPRLIASGLRKHYSLEEMLGSRVIVVANLKVRFDRFINSSVILRIRIFLTPHFFICSQKS
jgi:aminoacyl tRNA synthase complex-interacting multifunctional protein 1